MSQNITKMLKEAAGAYKNGDKDTARDLLLQIVGADENNEKAWLLLSAVVDGLEDRQIALENALTINPDNEKARKGLALIEKKLAEQRQKTEQASSGWSDMDVDSGPGPAASRRTGTQDQVVDDYEETDSGFGDVASFDQLISQKPGSASASPIATSTDDDAGPGWGDVMSSPPDEPSTAPAFSASAVDESLEDNAEPGWGDIPAVSDDWGQDEGSGVEQSSAENYDEWANSMNLQSGGEPTLEASVAEDDTGWGSVSSDDMFGSESSSIATSPSTSTSPFGETGGWGDDQAAASASPFGEGDAGWGEMGTSTADQGPFGASAVDDEPVRSTDPFGGAFSVDDADAAPSNQASFAPPSDPFEDAVPSEQVSFASPSDDPFGEPAPVSRATSGFGLGDDPFGDSEPAEVEAAVSAPVPDEPATDLKARVQTRAQQQAQAKPVAQKPKRADSDYFMLIPGDIQPAVSIREQLPLIGSVAGLALINVVALVVLIMQIV